MSLQLNPQLSLQLPCEQLATLETLPLGKENTPLFGKEYEDIFIDAVAAGGNYGEIYSFPMRRDGKNWINDGSTGLLATPPLGNVDFPDVVYNPMIGGTLDEILRRGVLHCGVRRGRPGFAVYKPDQSTWDGMDVEYCRALATALFDGASNSVIFEDISGLDGYAMLQNGSLDVLAGVVWTLQDEVNGNKFTAPYFYGPLNDTRFDENLCLATKQNDTEWSSFVFWSAQAPVYAEERGWKQADSFELPLIYSFGEGLARMFRDIVHYMGNYDDVYERHLASILPRNARNRLNLNEDEISPMGYVPPVFNILGA